MRCFTRMKSAARAWAEEEFGRAELGDPRRVCRLVKLSTSAATKPSGTITGVLTSSAEREGAFRFLQNKHISYEAVARASFEATARRCHEYPWVFVAVDGSSLSFADRACSRDVGHVGKWSAHGRGMIVTSALAVSPAGSPMGLCGQRFWAREARASRPTRKWRATETETARCVELLGQVRDRLRTPSYTVEPWFQLDRGYDAWTIWRFVRDERLRVTIRASHNRIVREGRHDRKSYLFNLARRAPVLGSYDLPVAERAGGATRIARMQVRARPVTLELKVSRKKREYVLLHLVVAKETRGTNPLHWVLLTTVPVTSLDEALAVIDGYAARWRIEEFHRAWKSGVCNVEDTQLRSREGILKWATILAAVAARATRLTYLAREKPESPATEELSRDEIDAAIALLQPKGIKLGAEPTLAQAVRWIADLGGYTGKSSGGPPGPTVISRGLQQVELMARGIRNLKEM
jgi:hypothetical protein